MRSIIPSMSTEAENTSAENYVRRRNRAISELYTPKVNCVADEDWLSEREERILAMQAKVQRALAREPRPAPSVQLARAVLTDRGERFESASRAARALGRHTAAVMNAIRRRHRCAGRVFWYEGNPPPILERPNAKCPVVRLSDGKFFEAMTDAVGGLKNIGLNAAVRRSRQLKTAIAKGREFEGSLWKYATTEQIRAQRAA